jgi:hypothetical protein
MFALTAALLAATLVGAPSPTPQAPGVRINLNGGGDYRPGDRVSVEIETGEDGYLVVFRVDGDGYVRVIFPLDPDLDPFVRGERRYELRGRGERQSFMADDRGVTGVVLAVLSRSPLDFSQYATDAHWDYERLRLDDPAGDAEAQLLGIARRMTRDDRFEYDMMGYRVWGPGYESDRPVVISGGGYDPYFDPSYDCLACGWGHPRSGVSIRVGGHYGGWYDPWYDPWDYRWDRYDRRYGWNGWWGWDPYWGTPWRPITVINTPPRPVVPNPIYGTRARPRLPGGALDAPNGAPRLTDPFPAARPVASAPTRTDGRSRARSGSTTPSESPSTGRSIDRQEPARRPTGESPSRGSQPSRGIVSPPQSAPPSTERSRSRRPETEQQLAPVVRPALEPRRVEERPVYRPPVQAPRTERRAEPSPSSRPTSSPPPRAERAPERAPERSAPTRVERAPERSSPPPSVERSSPPSSPPSRSGGESSGSRSRSTRGVN